jgi:hypothetical protein
MPRGPGRRPFSSLFSLGGLPLQFATPVHVPPSSAAARSAHAIRAGDLSVSTIIIAELAICRLKSLASTSNSWLNNIASRYARSLSVDRFHSAAKTYNSARACRS